MWKSSPAHAKLQHPQTARHSSCPKNGDPALAAASDSSARARRRWSPESERARPVPVHEWGSLRARPSRRAAQRFFRSAHFVLGTFYNPVFRYAIEYSWCEQVFLVMYYRIGIGPELGIVIPKSAAYLEN